MGMPTNRICLAWSARGRRDRLQKQKGRAFLQIKRKETATLTACAATVATAAPAAPIPKAPTSRRSPPMLIAQAIATVISGVAESPTPRKMAPKRLYATIKIVPIPQILV